MANKKMVDITVFISIICCVRSILRKVTSCGYIDKIIYEVDTHI